jgi:hypothetical protein
MHILMDLASLLKKKWLVQNEQDFKLTKLGREKLAELGVDLTQESVAGLEHLRLMNSSPAFRYFCKA